MTYLPPPGTNFSPDPSVSHTLGYDFFVFGYDRTGFYQANPGWNDAGLGGWPPAYVGDCNTAYNEDMSACQGAVGGTYTIPAQTCAELCGNPATCPDADGNALPATACRRHYSSHDEQATGGNTNMYNEKVEHQYELTALAGSAGAFFHGYFLDAFGLLGETVYTQPDGAGGFVSCSFTDYPWEMGSPTSTMAAQAAASAAASIYVSSFNQFCGGTLPEGSAELREQSKCWICQDIVQAYLGDMSYLPPAGTNFSPTGTSFTLGYDFFVFGYDAGGHYQGTPSWNDAGLGGWPPGYVGDCNTAYGEDLSDCKAAIGGTYTVPSQTCTELCGAASCDGGPTVCREHYNVHDEQSTGGGTNMYNEKVEHQYELTAKAAAGAFFHGYFLDAIGLSGETVYTQPTAGGGFMSCSFTDYSWESVTDTAATLAAMQSTLDTLVANGR